MTDKIVIKGAREHNLKGLNLELPRNQFVVFTGVSGSGKSSLAFDTLYAEGQRRYVESLSSYARQFLGQMEKPHVDYIGGLSPAISIEQKSASTNPRSTVGTVTEIYDYLRVLFARIGAQHCHQCGQLIGSQSAQQMADALLQYPPGTKLLILAPMTLARKGEHKEIFEDARNDGFVRVRVNGKIIELDEHIELDKKRKHTIEIVVDRLTINDSVESRLVDSIETALRIAEGYLLVSVVDGEERLFSEKRACLTCGIGFPELSPQLFSFNSPLGMCQTCNGLGFRLEPDPRLIIPDPEKSILEGAIAPWGDLTKKNNTRREWVGMICEQLQIDMTKPFNRLPEEQQSLILNGKEGHKLHFRFKGKNSEFTFDKDFQGVLKSVQRYFMESTSEAVRQMFARYISRKTCPDCQGRKLKPEILAVTLGGLNIHEVTALSIASALNFFAHLELTGQNLVIAEDILKEIKGRLGFLMNVGLHYLTLNRAAPSLSGGEAQRIRLASQIGCGLVGVLYILDEPSIGLHQRDNHRLLDTLLNLRDLGNTVIVVEHDREIMEAADYIVDFGPGAGVKGGEVVAAAPPHLLISHQESLTAQYLAGTLRIDPPAVRRKPSNRWLVLEDLTQNNLRNITVRFPLGLFICVTGVSGSGKSSLVNETLYRVLAHELHRAHLRPTNFSRISGLNYLNKVIEIDQKPIGRTPRSNPATYVKAYDAIRRLFAELPESKVRGYKAGRFSFNIKGGRCESCLGGGIRRIEMHFLPDVYVTCDHCKGERYNRETLQVKYRGLNISQVLDLEVSEALSLFKSIPGLRRQLQTLEDVGLGYIKLGQPATTLSGGEAQRVKLAKELSRIDTGKTIYILDEPTTGLHFHDIVKLLSVLQSLVDKGNTVVVIEHNLDVVKCADYIIDLGPEGGDGGGLVMAEGAPEHIIEVEGSFTGRYLKKYLRGDHAHYLAQTSVLSQT